MGVDFNRIGLGISSGTSRTGFGTIVSYPSGPAPENPPYGTYLGVGTEDLSMYWEYVGDTSNNGYFVYGYQDYTIYADGVGGTYIVYSLSPYTETAAFNQVIDSTGANSRIIYKGDGTYSDCNIADYIGGTENSGTVYTDIEYESGYWLYNVVLGTWDSLDYTDGFCGVTTVTTYNYIPYGTEVANAGSTYYYSDGAGGYYSA